MRLHATDSPDAVCRLLALSMIVDGELAPCELRTLQRSAILDRVGIDAERFDDAVHALCDDLLATARHHDGVHIDIDDALLDCLLDEVADAQLRILVLKGMLDVVHADRRIDKREALLLRRALRKWAVPAESLGGN